jgi:integrase
MYKGGVTMLYKVLNEYKEYLSTILTTATADTYYKNLSILFKGQSINDVVGNFDMDKVINNLSKIKYKNDFSKAKNALIYFCNFKGININQVDLLKISELENNTKKKYRRLYEIDFKKIDEKIKHIKNKKLKLCFEVMLSTGLRVTELSGIKVSDCLLDDKKLELSFIGKGGNKEKVLISRNNNDNLFDNLKDIIVSNDSNKKIFYSANYLQKKARELNFKCHDLRRIYARVEYKKTKSKKEVMNKLRHTSIKNTNIYLRRKVRL